MVETKRFPERIKMQKFSLKGNLYNYFASMRWYGAFISVMAGWLGIIFSGVTTSIFRQAAILAILFVGWGVNQIINDYLGLREDKFNAPERPMVTGALNARFALALSLALFIIGLMATYRLNPQANILYLFVFALNIVYERAKRMPSLGNITFGLLIAPCVYYGAVCVNRSKILDVFFDSNLAVLAILIWLINAVLCFFADFKDYQGDKIAKVNTLVVALGLHRAKYLGLFFATLPFLCLWYFLRKLLLFHFFINKHFLVMLTLTFFTFCYSALLLIKNPQGENTHYSLKWALLGVVLFETTLGGLIKPALSIIIFIFNLTCITLIFCLYKDRLL